MTMARDYLKNSFKHNIEKGVMQYGVAQETTSADVAEVLATSDYDWLFIDSEHGPHTLQTVLNVARAIAPYDMTPVVRVGEAGTGIFKQLLDSGIQNIIIPKVESGEETERIMYWVSYPSRGNRGMGAPAVRAARFGRHTDYFERIEDELCIMPQIESKKGIENLDAIVQTPGIGAIFLGPIDLAVDMGHGLNIFHPEVEAAMDDAIRRIRAFGVPVGTVAMTPEQAAHFKELGVSFLGVGADTGFLVQGADNTLKMFKQGV